MSAYRTKAQPYCPRPFECHHKTCKKFTANFIPAMGLTPRYLQDNPVGWKRFDVYRKLFALRRLRVVGRKADVFRAMEELSQAIAALKGIKTEYPDMPGAFRFDDPRVMAHYGKNHHFVVRFHLAVRKSGHKPEHARTLVGA
jgi:hypothetical protein